MTDAQKERWQELCAQAEVEQDSQKLAKLVNEINLLLLQTLEQTRNRRESNVRN